LLKCVTQTALQMTLIPVSLIDDSVVTPGAAGL
jgi:hypothetical protein